MDFVKKEKHNKLISRKRYNIFYKKPKLCIMSYDSLSKKKRDELSDIAHPNFANFFFKYTVLA